MQKLKEKLQSGKRIYGTAIVSPSKIWSNAVRSANLDFVFIDTEHIPLGRETVSEMCMLYSALNLNPIVRIPSPDPYTACTVLDGGAVGILVPYIETKEQVKELVGATKLRPIKGKKLNQFLDDPKSITPKLKKYIDERCKNNLLFINIESEPAVKNLSQILSVDGIDGIIIGPHDLSCSMGISEEYDHPKFEKAVKQIINKAAKKNIPVGIHLSEEPSYQIKWGNLGMNIILHSSDISIFSKNLVHDINEIKQGLEDVSSKSISKKSIII
ncbi:MAG: aldolase [Ignavibacteriae bacterium]|nr:aldolase [Ignavibacteriota bacterium]